MLMLRRRDAVQHSLHRWQGVIFGNFPSPAVSAKDAGTAFLPPAGSEEAGQSRQSASHAEGVTMSRMVVRTIVAVTAMLAAGIASAGKMHDVMGTVVSVDTAARTITLKGADGKTSTAPVEGDALKTLESLKGGEQVSVTCRDDDKGEHQAATAIKVVKKAAY